MNDADRLQSDRLCPVRRITDARRLTSVAALWTGLLWEATASAQFRGGGGPLVSFGQSLLDFLSGTLGPILFGLGLAVAAICLVLGARDGLLKAGLAIVGGALLFSVRTVVDFVQATAR